MYLSTHRKGSTNTLNSHSAPSIFQRTMTNLLQGIPKVCVYLDDILITGATEEEHLTDLSEVLSRLEKAGMHLRKDKCASGRIFGTQNFKRRPTSH